MSIRPMKDLPTVFNFPPNHSDLLSKVILEVQKFLQDGEPLFFTIQDGLYVYKEGSVVEFWTGQETDISTWSFIEIRNKYGEEVAIEAGIDGDPYTSRTTPIEWRKFMYPVVWEFAQGHNGFNPKFSAVEDAQELVKELWKAFGTDNVSISTKYYSTGTSLCFEAQLNSGHKLNGKWTQEGIGQLEKWKYLQQERISWSNINLQSLIEVIRTVAS